MFNNILLSFIFDELPGFPIFFLFILSIIGALLVFYVYVIVYKRLKHTTIYQQNSIGIFYLIIVNNAITIMILFSIIINIQSTQVIQILSSVTFVVMIDYILYFPLQIYFAVDTYKYSKNTIQDIENTNTVTSHTNKDSVWIIFFYIFLHVSTFLYPIAINTFLYLLG